MSAVALVPLNDGGAGDCNRFFGSPYCAATAAAADADADDAASIDSTVTGAGLWNGSLEVTTCAGPGESMAGTTRTGASVTSAGIAAAGD